MKSSDNFVRRYSLNILYGHPDAVVDEQGNWPAGMSRWCEYIIHTDNHEWLKFLVQSMTKGMGPYPAKLEGWGILEHKLSYGKQGDESGS